MRKLFKGGNYSREETIQRRKLFAEIGYKDMRLLKCVWPHCVTLGKSNCRNAMKRENEVDTIKWHEKTWKTCFVRFSVVWYYTTRPNSSWSRSWILLLFNFNNCFKAFRSRKEYSTSVPQKSLPNAVLYYYCPF